MSLLARFVSKADPTRDQTIARYLQLREIAKKHTENAFSFVLRDALQTHGRRLGLMKGRAFTIGSPDELAMPMDLALHTAQPGRTRAIDRYARSANCEPGSDEAIVLEAMRAAKFAILDVQRRHPVAGLMLRDTFRNEDVWLVDLGLEATMPVGASFATRYFVPAAFAMTAGVFVPMTSELMLRTRKATSPLHDKPAGVALQDRRYAEAIYREALADGTTERTRYVDPGDDDYDA